MTYKKISKDDFQNPYKEFPITLAANERRRIAYDTSYFRVLAATGSFKVNFYGQAGDTTVIAAGIGIKFDPIKWIELIDTSGGPNPITIALGICEIFDSRFTATGTLTVNQTRSGTLTGTADVTLPNAAAGTIIAQNLLRRSVIISSDPANTVNLRIGKNASVGAANGYLLQIGQSITLDTTAEVSGFASIAAQKVNILEVVD